MESPARETPRGAPPDRRGAHRRDTSRRNHPRPETRTLALLACRGRTDPMAPRGRGLARARTEGHHRLRPAKGPTLSNTIRMLDRPLTVDGVAIDRYSYYEEGDVLYLMVGPPTGEPAADDEDSLEGAVVFFELDGRVSGVTVIGARE